MNAYIPKVYSILLTVTEIWPRPSLTELIEFGVLTFLFGVKQVLTLYYNDAWLVVI